MNPITDLDAAKAIDGLDRAHRFVKQAQATLQRANDHPAQITAARELARAQAGLMYAAGVLRVVEEGLRPE